MTEISRSIEISAPREKVWNFIDPRNWTEVFHFVSEVDGYTHDSVGVGTQAHVVAGKDNEMPIEYNVEITEFQENEKIVYKRYGGPLAGKGVIQLRPLQKGTLFVRTSYYEDPLSEQIIKTLSEGMEKDNRRIKSRVESA